MKLQDDDSITLNDGKNRLSYNGIPLAASEVQWVSKADSGPGTIVTMKDGRVLLCGNPFTAEERTAVEKAFAGVRMHSGYRYGIWGVKPEGGIVAAVLAGPERMKQEKNAVRLPEVDEKATRRLKIAGLKGAARPPLVLTETGDLLDVPNHWFPKKVTVVPFPSTFESRALKNVVDFWCGDVHFTLTKSGRWYTIGPVGQSLEGFRKEMFDTLSSRKTPIKDLAVKNFHDKGKEARFAVWIE